MFDELRTNLILLILNIIALGNFAYPPNNQILVIFILLIIFPLPYSIKAKMRVVTLLSLVASFIVNQIVCEIFCILALGLAVNTAYQLDLTEGPSMINSALGLSQIFSYWSKQYLEKNTINRDITLLIFTLPNLFLCCQCTKSKSKTLYLINPFLDNKWLYSVGFIFGIFTTSFISIAKHYKFFIISILLFIEANVPVEQQIVIGVLSLIRGLLVYTEHINQNSERYFLLGFMIIKIAWKQYLLYYMFVGYLIMGVIIYQENKHRHQSWYGKKDQAIGTEQQIIESQFIELDDFKDR